MCILTNFNNFKINSHINLQWSKAYETPPSGLFFFLFTLHWYRISMWFMRIIDHFLLLHFIFSCTVQTLFIHSSQFNVECPFQLIWVDTCQDIIRYVCIIIIINGRLKINSMFFVQHSSVCGNLLGKSTARIYNISRQANERLASILLGNQSFLPPEDL